MLTQVALIAIDLTTERTREAERRARLLAGAGPDFDQPGRLRHLLARLAASVSRGAADLARRLDARALPDPGRGAAPSR